MPVGEVVAIVQFTVPHVHASSGIGIAIHGARILGSPYRTVVIGSHVVAAASTVHRHSRQRQVVFLRSMPSQSGTREDAVAHIRVAGAVVLVGVRVQERLVAHGAALAVAVAIAHVDEGIPLAAVVVEVETCLSALARVGASLHRTIVASLAVFLQHDVDDACRPFSRKLGRRVVDDLDALDALCRQLLQYLRTVVAGQSARLAVDPHLHAAVASQRHVAVLVNFYRRNILQRIGSGASGIADLLVHVERLAVHLQFHLLPLGGHRHLFQQMAVFRQVESGEVAGATFR